MFLLRHRAAFLGHFILVQNADRMYKMTYLGDRFLVLLELIIVRSPRQPKNVNPPLYRQENRIRCEKLP